MSVIGPQTQFLNQFYLLTFFTEKLCTKIARNVRDINIRNFSFTKKNAYKNFGTLSVTPKSFNITTVTSSYKINHHNAFDVIWSQHKVIDHLLLKKYLSYSLHRRYEFFFIWRKFLVMSVGPVTKFGETFVIFAC